MRCKTIYAFIVGAFMVAQTASGQQIPAASPQLKAPGTANTGLQVQTPPTAAPAVAGATAANAALSAGAAPVGAPNVVTLGQAASSAPAPASTPTGSTPPIVPAIQGNTVLATGSNARILDSAGPKGADGETKAKPRQDIELVRISYSDDEIRALLKVHGVARYVEVGSQVKKLIVRSISEEGVCLVNPNANLDSKKKKKSANSACAQTIVFQQ
jgi:hypothetical protein